MDINVKIPKLEGNEKEARQELKTFCGQVVAELEYQRAILETLSEKFGG